MKYREKGDNLLQLRKRKLINKTQRQASMLQHMREAQILELVLRCVNFLVGISKVGLDHESRGIPGL